MPLHLNSFVPQGQVDNVFRWICQYGISEANKVIVSEDKKILLIRKRLKDARTCRELGSIIYTLRSDDEVKANEVLDIDIVLNNDDSCRVEFQGLLEGSSDSNEYYHAATVPDDLHFELETVNRYAVSDHLLGTERDVSLSAFPFKVDVFDDISAFNKHIGFGESIRLGETELMVGGLSDKFVGTGAASNPEKDPEEHYTFFLGTVESFEKGEIAFGDLVVDYTIAIVSSGLGRIPVIMNNECFDLSRIHKGCVLAIYADIKADLGCKEKWIDLENDPE